MSLFRHELVPFVNPSLFINTRAGTVYDIYVTLHKMASLWATCICRIYEMKTQLKNFIRSINYHIIQCNSLDSD